MKRPTNEQISRLPKWAQDYINELKGRIDIKAEARLRWMSGYMQDQRHDIKILQSELKKSDQKVDRVLRWKKKVQQKIINLIGN